MTMMLIMAVAVGRQGAIGAVALRALRLNLNMLRNKQPGKYINESHPSFTAERMAFVLGNTIKFPSTTQQQRRSWWCSFEYVEEHLQHVELIVSWLFFRAKCWGGSFCRGYKHFQATRQRQASWEAVSEGLLHLCLTGIMLWLSLFFNRRPSVDRKKNRVYEKASITFLFSLHLIIIFSVLNRSPTGWLQIRPCVFSGAYFFTKPYSILAHIRKIHLPSRCSSTHTWVQYT